MINNKSFIKHEVLNIITLVNFLVEDTKIEKNKKEEILEHLAMVSLFIAEEDLFSGKKKEFFNQAVDLGEMLQMMSDLIEEEAKKSGVQIKFPKGKLTVNGDARVIKNGIETLLRCLIPISKNIRLDVDKSVLKINYESEHFFEIPSGPLVDYIKIKHPYPEIFCKVAVEMLKANGIKAHFKKGIVEITFP